ncbi:hypothetical protein BsWGS_17007 [Bradybaena similaris]
MPWPFRSEKCTKKSKFRLFFTSKKTFEQDIPEEENNTQDSIVEEPRDPNQVDYNKTGVHELGEDEFRSFVTDQDVCLVLFYSKDGEDSALAIEAFSKAAAVTDRPYSAFAQVDCNRYLDLCLSEDSRNLPYYKMYSRGATVGIIRDFMDFPSQSMKAYVEKCPVLRQVPQGTPLSPLFPNCK